MKSIKPGSVYVAGSIHGTKDQEIVFMDKQTNRQFHEEKAGLELPDYFFETIDVDPDDYAVTQDGTSNEELLKILIDRTEILNENVECSENTDAIYHMQQALDAFRSRTSDRRSRGVQSTTVA